MPGFKITCCECGKVAIRGNKTARYCEACAKVADRRGKRKYDKQRVMVSGDTEAMRKMCLSCNSPRCYGSCEALFNLVKEERNGI